MPLITSMQTMANVCSASQCLMQSRKHTTHLSDDMWWRTLNSPHHHHPTRCGRIFSVSGATQSGQHRSLQSEKKPRIRVHRCHHQSWRAWKPEQLHQFLHLYQERNPVSQTSQDSRTAHTIAIRNLGSWFMGGEAEEPTGPTESLSRPVSGLRGCPRLLKA